MQLYCVSDVHFCQITCVEWSQNTLKLFSGDQDGCVACSEMDYAEVTMFQKYMLLFCNHGKSHKFKLCEYSQKEIITILPFVVDRKRWASAQVRIVRKSDPSVLHVKLVLPMQEPYVFYRRKCSIDLFSFDAVCDSDFNLNISSDDLILPFSKIIKHIKLEKNILATEQILHSGRGTS